MVDLGLGSDGGQRFIRFVRVLRLKEGDERGRWFIRWYL